MKKQLKQTMETDVLYDEKTLLSKQKKLELFLHDALKKKTVKYSSSYWDTSSLSNIRELCTRLEISCSFRMSLGRTHMLSNWKELFRSLLNWKRSLLYKSSGASKKKTCLPKFSKILKKEHTFPISNQHSITCSLSSPLLATLVKYSYSPARRHKV